MPKKFFLKVLLTVSLFFSLSLSAFSAEYQVSGTGYNYPVPLFRASVSVNVNSLSLGTSYFRYYYTRNRLSFISTSITGITVSGNTAAVAGSGTVNGTAGYAFTATVIDSGVSAAQKDSTAIEIRKPDGGIYFKDPSSGARSIESGNFIITVTKTWSGGGSDNLASNPANWSDSTPPQNGDVIVFNSTSSKNCTWDMNITVASLSINTGYTGMVTLSANPTITGSITITSGALNAAFSTITVKGNWTNNSSFSSGTSTVILNGTNQTIYGNNTFYNLTKNTAFADTLYFEAGKTQAIVNSLTLNGANGGMLFLRSASQGAYWLIEPQSTRNISFADVKDSKNIHPVIINAVNSISSGNNVNWGISSSLGECVCRRNKFVPHLSYS